MIVVKHGPREMQLAWTHLLPATFAGRARMNVQNALAAAAAAFAAGAPLHDIRQGLRSFSTNYYLAPGRLNEVEVSGVNVIVDYCHNAPGMKMLGDFVDRVGESLESSHELARPSRIGIIATAGDRRDEDMRELGYIAAQHFDVVIVREDANARGRERGEVAALVSSGVRAAMEEGIARCKQAEEVLDEIDAVRHAMARANKGDLVVICVDKHAAVMSELENWSPQAQAGAGVTSDAPAADPDYVPAEPAPVDA
jgi:cyanophycin synthetase